MPAKPWHNSPPQELPPAQNPCQRTEHDVLEMAVAVIASVTIHGCLGWWLRCYLQGGDPAAQRVFGAVQQPNMVVRGER